MVKVQESRRIGESGMSGEKAYSFFGNCYHTSVFDSCNVGCVHYRKRLTTIEKLERLIEKFKNISVEEYIKLHGDTVRHREENKRSEPNGQDELWEEKGE